MISPALLALPLDPVIAQHPAAQRVYLRLLSVLSFNEARPVKGWVLSEELLMKRATIYHSLNLLVERGYLIEQERENPRGVRCFCLAWSIENLDTRVRDFVKPTPQLRSV